MFYVVQFCSQNTDLASILKCPKIYLLQQNCRRKKDKVNEACKKRGVISRCWEMENCAFSFHFPYTFFLLHLVQFVHHNNLNVHLDPLISGKLTFYQMSFGAITKRR